MKMLDNAKIKEITYNTVQFALNQLSKEGYKSTSEDVITLASSISASIIFNLIELIVSKQAEQRREEQRVYYAMTMWSVNKNIYKTLEAKGIDNGNFSMQFKKME